MKPAIVMQTDFSRDESVAAMYGVVASIDPDIPIFDGNHAIPPFQVWVAGTDLAYIVDYWPRGTIFVSVVDPGVGTSRRGCVALLKNGRYVVTPDNGTLTQLAMYIGVEAVREIDMAVNRLPATQNCNIFHGRDVFAYTAARLAAGVIDFEGVGPAYPVEEIITLPVFPYSCENGVHLGMVVTAHPHFGLVSSNIPHSMVEEAGLQYGDFVEIVIGRGDQEVYRENVEYQRSFGYVKKGAPILYDGSMGFMEVTLNAENMVKKYGIGAGPGWRIHIQKL